MVRRLLLRRGLVYPALLVALITWWRRPKAFRPGVDFCELGSNGTSAVTTGTHFQSVCIPPSETLRYDDDACPNCHLNSSCFEYDKNLWYPTACASRLVAGDALDACLDGGRTVVLAGDSRMRQVAHEFAAAAHYEVFNFYKADWDVESNKATVYRMSRRSPGASLEMAFAWHTSSTDSGYMQYLLKEMKKLQGPRSRYVILGGNAAWTLRPPAEVARDPERLRSNVENDLERLRRTIADIEMMKMKNMELIYIMDFEPVRIGIMGVTSEDHDVLSAAVRNMSAAARDLLRREFPSVVVMDSHLHQQDTYVELCRRKGNRNRFVPDFVPRAAYRVQNQFRKGFNCLERWHPGRLQMRQIAQLLLNHICPKDGR